MAVWGCMWQRGCMEDNFQVPGLHSKHLYLLSHPGGPLSSVMFMCSVHMSPVYACAVAYACHQLPLLPYFFPQALSLNLESAFWDLILSLPPTRVEHMHTAKSGFCTGTGSNTCPPSALHWAISVRLDMHCSWPSSRTYRLCSPGAGDQ